jgi:glycosyltransferase involved in cell wall biosynthesis
VVPPSAAGDRAEPSAADRRPLRLAYASPLPPEGTGIADYSAELLPVLGAELAAHGGEVVAYTARPEAAPRALTAVLPVRGYAELSARRGDHDLVLYHLGNNPDFHAEIYALLGEIPGVVVLHEPMLHHLVRGLTLSRGDAEAYVRALRRCHGAPGEAVGRAFVDQQRPFDIFRFPLFEEAVDRSLGLIVHNEYTRQRVLASRPATTIAVVPHHLSLAELGTDPAVREAERAALRARLGLAEGVPVLGSYGFVTPAKRLEVMLGALRRLREERLAAGQPAPVLLLAGDVSPYYDLDAVLAAHGGDGVVHRGGLSLPDFLRAMDLADVAINLRYPTSGETSGTLMRLLGLGKAVVVTDAGSFAELPESCAARVPLDAAEEETLLAILRRLLADEPFRRALGRNAAHHLATHHRLEGSARRYREFLTTIAAEVADGRLALPTPAPPPLVPPGPDDVLVGLLARLAADAVDLGVDERDQDLLRGLATAVVELGLDQPGGGSAPPPAGRGGDPRR